MMKDEGDGEVKVDGRKLRGQPVRRYSEPHVMGAVGMDGVPAPALAGRVGIGDRLYAQICKLKRGMALEVRFETCKHAEYTRGRVRKKAKDDGQFLSSSRSDDGCTRYFWLEKQ